MESTRPDVVSVADPLDWQLTGVGTATITATWSGKSATSRITVFDDAVLGAPSLEFSLLENGSAKLTWPGYAAGYLLETTSAVAPDASWIRVEPEPITAGGWNSVVLPAASDTQFYRLHRP